MYTMQNILEKITVQQEFKGQETEGNTDHIRKIIDAPLVV